MRRYLKSVQANTGKLSTATCQPLKRGQSIKTIYQIKVHQLL